jgi:outer membrane protein OmpA-like peptidoglycan-associated protein
MKKILVLLTVLTIRANCQDSAVYLRTGDQAPFFIVNVQDNGIRSFTMPYMRRIVLLHFWSTESFTSRMQNKYLKRVTQKYRNQVYRNADGFDVIAIAVQSDKSSWKQVIEDDSLNLFIHGIALKGIEDATCKKYGIRAVPTDILVDATGKVIAIDPRAADIENILDEQKNNQPLRKDIRGILAQSSNSAEVLKYGRVFLLNDYGDTVARTITTDDGVFTFNNVKLNHELVVKVDNKIDINTTDPIALYGPNGTFMLDGRTKDEGFVFNMPTRLSNKLIVPDSSQPSADMPTEIDVIKNLTFNEDGTALTPRDEKELLPVLSLLQKNKLLNVEITAHTDARLDKEKALDLTAVQANTVKDFFEKKGVPVSRIQAVAKGNSELRKLCEGTVECREEDHRINRRVELLVYRN